MATKTLRTSCFFLLFVFCYLLFALSPIEAQVSTGGSAELRLVQRLAWKGDQYAERYEVIIDREQNGSYRNVLREFINVSFIEVTLPPGKYRLRVTAYDYFDQPGDESELFFEVRPAIKPELDERPARFVYRDEDALCELIVSGKDLDPNAEIYLRRTDGAIVLPIEVSVHDNGTQARLLFNKDDLPKGEYDLIIKNPGGLETRSEGIAVAYPEPESEPKPERIRRELPFEIYVAAAWLPLFPIYGTAFGEKVVILPGAAARIGIVSSNKDPFDAGAELTACWYQFDTQNAVTMELNLLAKTQLPHQAMSLGFRLGAGYNLLLADEKPETLTENIFTNIGVSFRWLILKHLYLETGLDYTHQFTKIPTGGLKPWLGIGWQIANNGQQ